MGIRRDKSKDENWSEMEAHDKLLDLCAVSTSGELTEEKQRALGAHLAKCPSCRESLKQFEAAVSIGVPLLHSQLLSLDSSESGAAPAELSTTTSIRSTARVELAPNGQGAVQRGGGFGLAGANGLSPIQVNWNYVWMPFAAAVVLMAALGIYS